jgi:hypothetical protein
MLRPMHALTLLLFAALPQGKLATSISDLAADPAGGERTLAASSLLVGTPYGKEPLGEGRPPHARPRLRLDEMDCQTFVETAMALGQAEDETELRAALDDLRYRSAPDYAERNHFMMSQWVPHNVEKGYLRDITHELFPDAPTADKVVTANSWAKRSPKTIELPADRIPLGQHTLAYVPLKSLTGDALARIPNGTVLIWVRADAPRYPDRVTHLGFLVRQGKRTMLRHESDVYHRVVDEPLDHFIARNSRYEWKVLGASLFEVEDNSAHVRGLVTPAPPAAVPEKHALVAPTP